FIPHTWNLAGCSFLVSLKSFMGELRYWAPTGGAQTNYIDALTTTQETTQDIKGGYPPIKPPKNI
ncbi:hypothetical protein, partial [Enterobacter intestinihominis]